MRHGSDYSFWIVGLIAAFLLFFNLGGVPLLDPDEPVYAQTPKEMLAFHDLISPRIYGEYWYDKPPLYYWLVAGAFQFFGVSEFAARFPSALLGLLTVLAVYRSATRLFDERVGMVSALILTTSIEFFYLGKAAVTDITLNFCLTMALLSFLEKRYYLFYFFAALATVAKGPVGILFPGAILFLYMLLTQRWYQLKEMNIPMGIIIYAVTALPWYVVMYQIHGNAFIDTFIGFHNITRFTSPEHPEGVLWYYFIPVLILGFFPWTAVLVQSVWNSLTGSGRHFEKLVFFNVWAWFIFIFFTISQTKLVSYILPMFVPLAVITGWYIASIMDQSYRNRQRGWAGVLGIMGGLFVGGLLTGVPQMPHLAWGAYAASTVFGLMTLIAVYLLWTSRIRSALWVQISGMSMFVIVLMTMLLPPAAPFFSVKEISQDMVKHYDGQSPLYVVKFLRPGLAFYTDRYGVEIESNWGSTLLLTDVIKREGKAYYVVRESHYNRLPQEQKKLVTVLAQQADRMLLLKER